MKKWLVKGLASSYTRVQTFAFNVVPRGDSAENTLVEMRQYCQYCHSQVGLALDVTTMSTDAFVAPERGNTRRGSLGS